MNAERDPDVEDADEGIKPLNTREYLRSLCVVRPWGKPKFPPAVIATTAGEVNSVKSADNNPASPITHIGSELGVVLGVTEIVAVMLRDGVGVMVGETEIVEVRLPVRVLEGVLVGVRVIVTEEVKLTVKEMVGVKLGLSLMDSVGAAVSDMDSDGAGVSDKDGVVVSDSVMEGVMEMVREIVGVREGKVALSDLVIEGVRLNDREGDRDVDDEAVWVPVREGDDVSEAESDKVGELDPEMEMDFVSEIDAVLVGDKEAERVTVPVPLMEAVGEAV
jgi:hypothetical protein